MEMLEDEDASIKYGQSKETFFTNNKEGDMHFSAWNRYPTEENPDNKY